MVEMSEVVATAVAAAMVLVIMVMAQTSGRGWAAMVAVMMAGLWWGWCGGGYDGIWWWEVCLGGALSGGAEPRQSSPKRSGA